MLFRLGVFPLFLFSGAFFPITNLGPVLEWVARLTPLWHGVNLSRMFCLDTVDWSLAAVNVAVLVVLTVRRLVLVGDRPRPSGWWPDMATPDRRGHAGAADARARPPGCCVLRNYLVYRTPGSSS